MSSHATPPTNEPIWLSLAKPPRKSVLAELRGLLLSSRRSDPYYINELKKQIATEEELEAAEAEFQEDLNLDMAYSPAVHKKALAKLDMLLRGWDPTLGGGPEAAAEQIITTEVALTEEPNEEHLTELNTLLDSYTNALSSLLSTATELANQASLDKPVHNELVSVDNLLASLDTAFGNFLETAEDSLTNHVEPVSIDNLLAGWDTAFGNFLDTTDDSITTEVSGSEVSQMNSDFDSSLGSEPESQATVTDQQPRTPVAKLPTIANHLHKSEEGDFLFGSWWAWELRKGGVGKVRKKWNAGKGWGDEVEGMREVGERWKWWE